ncbi:MAG TPA: hypothetical protein VFP68_05285 [Burkholderiaceae bacterium]|nr:hypothetical protein [Burkholderiaceae bacterium]
MTFNVASRFAELRQLLRLRELRQEGARADREARRAERDHVAALLQEHQAQLEELNLKRRALADWVAGEGASSMTQLQAFANARHAFLAEACERAEYAVLDDQEALANAEQQLAQAHERWIRACSQTQSVERLLARTRADMARRSELRAEREIEPAVRPAHEDIRMEGLA